ncbi:uncharacterized protein LOC123635717 isoform X2 [Lemur catta]|uniref:uncharacterized protein LOC123635717 isoform X2 n=1 Tax=Lemur catta TaxID=9447 RepID=UPI001E2667BE|nr:uncharacterized protein LOC123635717 isoform X2 [Lemur catta]
MKGEPTAKKARSNPQVYMDIKIGNKPAGRIQVLLRSDIVRMRTGPGQQGQEAKAEGDHRGLWRICVRDTFFAASLSCLKQKRRLVKGHQHTHHHH